MRADRAVVAAVCVLVFAASGSAEDWVAVRSPHFLVASNAGEKEARRTVRQFELIRGLFAEVFKARVDPVQPVIILAVRGEEDLKKLLPRYWERKGQARPAGLFAQGTDKHFIALRLDASGEQPYHVIYHEYVHLLTRLNTAWLPVWLDEGLAEFFGGTKITDDEVRWGQLSSRQIRLLRERRLSLEEVLAVDRESPVYNQQHEGTIFYAQSWALTHMLLIGDEKRSGSVDAFVKLLGEGVEERTALSSAFGDTKKLDRELFSYVGRKVLPGRWAKVGLQEAGVSASTLSAAESSALRADFMFHTGSLEGADALVQEALRGDPNCELAHEVRGHLSWQRGDRTEAAQSYGEAVRLAPQSYLAQFYRASVIGPGQSAEATRAKEQALRRAIEIYPGFAPGLAQLAELYRDERRDLAGALELARKALMLDPTRVRYRLVVASILSEMGRGEDANALEKDALKLARADLEITRDVASFYVSRKRYTDVEALLRGAVQQRPKSGQAMAQLAFFLVDRKQHEEAEGLLRAALKLDPDSPMLLNALGYTYASHGVHLEEALSLVEKALDKTPESPTVLDSKAWALFRLGRLEEAEAIQRRAIALRDDHPVMLDHMGDILEKRGKHAEAVEYWKRALTRDINDPEVRVAIERKLKAATAGDFEAAAAGT